MSTDVFVSVDTKKTSADMSVGVNRLTEKAAIVYTAVVLGDKVLSGRYVGPTNPPRPERGL